MEKHSKTVRYEPLEDLTTGTVKSTCRLNNPESLREKEEREVKRRLNAYRQSYNNGLSLEEAEDIALQYNKQFSSIIKTWH